jgi:hypothetical protein
MKPKHQSELEGEIYAERIQVPSQFVSGSLQYQFLWVWRLLFLWGWNGKRNTFSISFYQPDLETEIWSIGEY